MKRPSLLWLFLIALSGSAFDDLNCEGAHFLFLPNHQEDYTFTDDDGTLKAAFITDDLPLESINCHSGVSNNNCEHRTTVTERDRNGNPQEVTHVYLNIRDACKNKQWRFCAYDRGNANHQFHHTVSNSNYGDPQYPDAQATYQTGYYTPCPESGETETGVFPVTCVVEHMGQQKASCTIDFGSPWRPIDKITQGQVRRLQNS